MPEIDEVPRLDLEPTGAGFATGFCKGGGGLGVEIATVIAASLRREWPRPRSRLERHRRGRRQRRRSTRTAKRSCRKRASSGS